ncbi:MAG: hypothetical protein Q9200_003150 [Gallowayella weberi]
MASAIMRSDPGSRAVTEINMLLEHGYIHAFLNSLPATKLLAAPLGHFAPSNLTIWLHVPDKGEGILAIDDLQSMNPDDQLAKLHHAAIQFEKAWNKTGLMRLRIEKMASKLEEWDKKYRKYGEEMAPYEGDNANGERIWHFQGIERQKKHIASLARSLQGLQREHYIQESDKAAEKEQAIADMGMTPETTALYQDATFYSRPKPGHEYAAANIQEDVMEFIFAGAKLERMLGLPVFMEAKLNKEMSKVRAFGTRFKQAGSKYNQMRIDCHQKMLRLEQCFLALGHEDNFVSAALGTLEEIKAVYGQAVLQGYRSAHDQVMRKRFGNVLMPLAETNYVVGDAVQLQRSKPEE